MRVPEYGQFCPVSRGAEIFAERWTPLILRELLNGSHRFSELQIGLPRISRNLLTQRLASAITKPQLDVRIAAFRGKKVHVTGEVLQPSPMPLTDVPGRVQDAIAFARGFTPEADPGNVTLARVACAASSRRS